MFGVAVHSVDTRHFDHQNPKWAERHATLAFGGSVQVVELSKAEEAWKEVNEKANQTVSRVFGASTASL